MFRPTISPIHAMISMRTTLLALWLSMRADMPICPLHNAFDAGAADSIINVNTSVLRFCGSRFCGSAVLGS
jgi:hypothetical protein